jgi:hypothetical protein
MTSLSKLAIVPAVLIMFLSACGGGDDSGGSSSPSSVTVSSGEFLDSAVQGLEYAHSNGKSGITDSNGTYAYGEGFIEFFIGDISLGEAEAQFMMSPLNLAGSVSATNPTATNVARFLQILDDDANAANGILITEQVRAAAIGKTINFAQSIAAFESDSNVQTVLAELTLLTTAGQRDFNAVSSTDAQSHLSNTLASLTSGLSAGDYNGTATSTFSNCPSNVRDTVSSGSITVSSATNSYLAASGSFSTTVSGVTVREDFSMSGSLSLNGVISGNLFSDAYQNGEYYGSGTTTYNGKFSSHALQFKTPAQSLDYIQQGCVHNGTLIVVTR